MVCKLDTKTSILAATNPKGHYDPNEVWIDIQNLLDIPLKVQVQTQKPIHKLEKNINPICTKHNIET